MIFISAFCSYVHEWLAHCVTIQEVRNVRFIVVVVVVVVPALMVGLWYYLFQPNFASYLKHNRLPKCDVIICPSDNSQYITIMMRVCSWNEYVILVNRQEKHCTYFLFCGFLFVEVFRSHIIKTHTHTVGLLWTSDQLVSAAATM